MIDPIMILKALGGLGVIAGLGVVFFRFIKYGDMKREKEELSGENKVLKEAIHETIKRENEHKARSEKIHSGDMGVDDYKQLLSEVPDTNKKTRSATKKVR